MLIDSILNYIFTNNDYYNLVYTKLKENHFKDRDLREIFKKMREYVMEYSQRPTYKDVALLIDTDSSLTDEESDILIKKIKEIKNIETTDNYELLVKETEKWLLHRSCELAVLESAKILETDGPKGKMVDLMKEAVSVSLENNLGFKYGEDAERQFKFYSNVDEVLHTGLRDLDGLLGGGFRRKALFLFIGRVNIGKTLWLCHSAASLVKNGFNVVYYTAEMAEESITKRIDANVLDLQMNSLSLNLEKEYYLNRVKDRYLDVPNRGDLFVKEYPTGYGTRDHILQHLNELKLKEGFIPDAIVVDSVNIFASSRLPSSMLGNTYVYQKAVVEEFRAISIEKNIALITATQLNRESANKGADSLDMTGTGDSWSLPQTADWQGAIIQPPEMYEQGKYLLKNLKTRFDENLYKVETFGVDRHHMRLFTLDEDEKDIPITLKDKMEYQDKLREEAKMKEDDRVFVFDEDFD